MSQSPPADPWKPMGLHFYRIDGDTLFVRTNGDATLEGTVLYTELCRQLITQNGYVLSIVDLTVSGSASPEARRYQARAIQEFPRGSSEVAVYGMSRVVGTFLQLTARAATLLTGRDARVAVVGDEAAALRWRDERRPELRARFGRTRRS